MVDKIAWHYCSMHTHIVYVLYQFQPANIQTDTEYKIHILYIPTVMPYCC